MSAAQSRLARWFPRLVGLIAVARDPRKPASTRRFAAAEAVLFPLSLLTVAGLVVFAGVKLAFGVALPEGWVKVTVTLLASGAVGYLTNYVAVRMLFEPYSTDRWHWLRTITLGWWRLGLVPARQAELAKVAGAQVARLLPPQTVADELMRLISVALDDSQFRKQIARALSSVVREGAPDLVKRFAPELMTLLNKAASDGLTRENLHTFYDRVVEPLLADPPTRDRMADGLIHAIRAQTPRVLALARGALDRYTEEADNSITRFFRSAAVGIGEAVGAIDWDDIEVTIHRHLETHESREQLLAVLGGFVEQLRDGTHSPELAGAMERLQASAGEFVREFAEKFMTEELPAVAARLADADEFWHWLAHDGLDRFKPALLTWLKTGGVYWLAEKFDVSGRVAAAISALDVHALHDMVDTVAAEQLGAIQVLGFVLGLAAGVFLAVVV